MFTDFLVHYQPTFTLPINNRITWYSCRSLIWVKCEPNELTLPPSYMCLFVGGCTVKQTIYRCYHRLNSWRATFCYCQMCWFLVSSVCQWRTIYGTNGATCFPRTAGNHFCNSYIDPIRFYVGVAVGCHMLVCCLLSIASVQRTACGIPQWTS